MEVNWEEAPEAATHHLAYGVNGTCWWIKINEDERGYWYALLPGIHDWSYSGSDFFEVYKREPWIVVKRPRIKQEERVMFTAKQLSGTYPHKQMKMYIQATTPAGVHLPSALGKLVKKFMANCAENDHLNGVPDDVDGAFVWADTPEGHEFWQMVNNHKPPHRAPGFDVFAFDEFRDHVAEPVWPEEAAAVARPKLAPVPKAPKPEPAPEKVGWW